MMYRKLVDPSELPPLPRDVIPIDPEHIAATLTPEAITGAWERIRQRLRVELGEDVFSSWFSGLQLATISGTHIQLTVPTRFLRSWISSKFADRLLGLVQSEWPHVREVTLGVRTAGQRAAPTIEAQAVTVAQASPRAVDSPMTAVAAGAGRPGLPATADADGLGGSPLDRKFTFETFLVGKSNEFAFAAGQQVARAVPGRTPVFNPLYIHAAVGLGKTHLCQAVAQAAEASGRRVIYLTAEKFMYGFVAALKAQTAIAFKEKLRAIDVLVIDDTQFLTGKALQNEFCHTLNALIDAGKQVVVAADRAPCDLEHVEERMRSRLKAGLVVSLDALDEDLRRRILEARIAAARTHFAAFEVRPEVVTWLARNLTANGRDLEGAVNRMLAHATLTGQPLDLSTAEAAIKDLVRMREPKKVKIEDIQRLVANHYNVSKADILSARRTATVVRPRQIAMYLAKTLTLRSLPEIGRRFGGRDHTTVLHAVRKIEDLATRDQGLASEIDLLKRILQD
jgi:chromosomal replication initiator protein